MDIPTIKFTFFDKLKLYRDYLAPSSVFEKQKQRYWQHEKMFCLWAYSNIHQHLYRPLSNQRLFQIYGIKEENKGGKIIHKGPKDFEQTEIARIGTERLSLKDIIYDLVHEPGKIGFVKGNLVVKEFGDPSGEKREGIPDSVRINRRGILLGEIIHEAYHRDTPWYLRDFLIYKFTYFLLIAIITIAVLSLIFAMLNQFFELTGLRLQPLHFSDLTLLIIQISGLVLLFVGNLFISDAVTKWDTKTLKGWKIGNFLQILGFVISLFALFMIYFS